MIVIVGGGEIATRGIVPTVGGVTLPQAECDVTDWPAVAAAMGRLAPDVVVYTAGVSHVAPIADSDPARWRREIDTNLLGGYHVARAAPAAATLVFVASLAGLYGKPGHSGYSASKAGLISLVQSLAMEGRRAYAISPGRVDTGMRERDYPDEDPRTRLDPLRIGEIVSDVLAGSYTPGDNIVIRMRGHQVLPIEVHRGDGWCERLRVGQPPTC